jgi:uncharacterized phage-like protein YoqJ
MPIWIHEFILSMTDQIWYTYDKDKSTQPPWAVTSWSRIFSFKNRNVMNFLIIESLD